MDFYQQCPHDHGYPRFVNATFLDGDWNPAADRTDSIPATQNGMGILSYLKYYEFGGRADGRLLRTAASMGDYLVKECRTPPTGRYPSFTRSTGHRDQFPLAADCGSQSDRPFEVQPDKAGIAGYALLLLHAATGEARYLQQSLQNARVLLSNQGKGDEERSPWPFRADHRTGEGRGPVSGNMAYILRLYDALASRGYSEFATARANLWAWIKQHQIPSARGTGHLFAQFFEDHDTATNVTAWAPLNLARYLLEQREALDAEWHEESSVLIEFVRRRFTHLEFGISVCHEQDEDREAWGGINSTYGAVLALFARATGSESDGCVRRGRRLISRCTASMRAAARATCTRVRRWADGRRTRTPMSFIITWMLCALFRSGVRDTVTRMLYMSDMVKLALLASLVGAGGNAQAACRLTNFADLPVTMVDMQPMVSAKINGADALFVADSGAFYSTISAASAIEYKLKTTPASHRMYMGGIGGRAALAVTTVKEFKLAGIPISNVEFAVGGGEVGHDAAGLLGQNLFRIGDVEYDLAQGVIHLMREDGCKNAALAYWATGPESHPSALDIQYTTAASPHTTGAAYLNGTKIKVVFDTGASVSFVSLRAAERAGIKLDGPDVKEAGYSVGIGRVAVKTWLVVADSFKIGDEEIKHARLRVGDFGDLAIGDMLLGADFFLSHRVFVAPEQEKLFFTYNGGAVFNLTTVTAVAETAPPSAVPAGPSAALEDLSETERSKEAAEFSRRGAAFTSRHDFAHAMADLDRACVLAPQEPNYFYERGVAKAESGAAVDAATDFAEAIRLQPDHVPALLARAELRLRGVNADGEIVEKSVSPEQVAADRSAAIDDLNAADRVAAKEADARLRMAIAYARAEAWQSSVSQLDLWIMAHQVDARLGGALTERCWARASLNSELRKALDDCNYVYRRVDKKNEGTARMLDARALVRMRLGDYEESIDDFNAALKLRPKDAWALYGRGVDKTRRGDSATGLADIEAANALSSAVADRYKRLGISPSN